MADLRRCLVILTGLGLAAGCGGGDQDPPLATTPTSLGHASVTVSSIAPSPEVPPVSAQARAAGFVDIRTVVPSARLDLRYATTNNFVGVALYPPSARCLVHESMAPGLVAAAHELSKDGVVLVFWDCYRPHEVQVRMFDAVPDPAWVARPGASARSHEAGRSVDVTFARADDRCPVERQLGALCLAAMGTDFDEFSPRAEAFATSGIDGATQANRARLREAMATGGLSAYRGEWWHFDGPEADVERPILDVPVD